jgi:WD40 repeat protein
LFSKAEITTDAEEYSLRRFQTTLERAVTEDLSPLALIWKKKINSALFPLKNVFGLNKETHASLLLSRDETFVVSKSSTGIFRVYDAKTQKLISEAPSVSDASDYRAEVIYANGDHFVVAIESTATYSQDKYNGTLGFHPHHLILFTREAKWVGEYYADGRMKNSSVSPDGKYWLNATQSNFDVYDIAGKRNEAHWLIGVQPHNYDLIVNAATFSPDGSKLIVAGGDSKGRHTASIYVYSFEGASKVNLLEEIAIPASRVYGIDASTPGKLIIEGTPIGEDSHSSMSKTEIPY